MGIPEYEAKRYQGLVKGGGILLSVHSDNSNESNRAKEILERTGAQDISSTGRLMAIRPLRRSLQHSCHECARIPGSSRLQWCETNLLACPTRECSPVPESTDFGLVCCAPEDQSSKSVEPTSRER